MNFYSRVRKFITHLTLVAMETSFSLLSALCVTGNSMELPINLLRYYFPPRDFNNWWLAQGRDNESLLGKHEDPSPAQIWIQSIAASYKEDLGKTSVIPVPVLSMVTPVKENLAVLQLFDHDR